MQRLSCEKKFILTKFHRGIKKLKGFQIVIKNQDLFMFDLVSHADKELTAVSFLKISVAHPKHSNDLLEKRNMMKELKKCPFVYPVSDDMESCPICGRRLITTGYKVSVCGHCAIKNWLTHKSLELSEAADADENDPLAVCSHCNELFRHCGCE